MGSGMGGNYSHVTVNVKGYCHSSNNGSILAMPYHDTMLGVTQYNSQRVL